MQKKLKECDGCQKMTVIWKNFEGNRFCKYCWSCHSNNKHKSQKPKKSVIPQVSSRKKKKDLEYSKLRKRYLEENNVCNVNVKGCTRVATDVHHTRSGSDRDIYYLIQSTWMPVCRNCHNWIHNNPSKSRELNYLK